MMETRHIFIPVDSLPVKYSSCVAKLKRSGKESSFFVLYMSFNGHYSTFVTEHTFYDRFQVPTPYNTWFPPFLNEFSLRI